MKGFRQTCTNRPTPTRAMQRSEGPCGSGGGSGGELPEHRGAGFEAGHASSTGLLDKPPRPLSLAPTSRSRRPGKDEERGVGLSNEGDESKRPAWLGDPFRLCTATVTWVILLPFSCTRMPNAMPSAPCPAQHETCPPLNPPQLPTNSKHSRPLTQAMQRSGGAAVGGGGSQVVPVHTLQRR